MPHLDKIQCSTRDCWSPAALSHGQPSGGQAACIPHVFQIPTSVPYSAPVSFDLSDSSVSHKKASALLSLHWSSTMIVAANWEARTTQYRDSPGLWGARGAPAPSKAVRGRLGSQICRVHGSSAGDTPGTRLDGRALRGPMFVNGRILRIGAYRDVLPRW